MEIYQLRARLRECFGLDSTLSEVSGGGLSEPPSMGREPFWLVVYFDQLQTRQADRNRLMRQIRRFLDTVVGSRAEVMIGSF